MGISRRDFVKIGTLAPLSRLVPASVSGLIGTETVVRSLDDLYRRFKEPTNAARPFVRWWWNGLRLDKAEILRELDLLKEKGISGVEINSIAFPALDDPMGQAPCEWLGEEWLEMVKIALDGAGKRGMTCDIIVGSGWPFGGEFLTKEEQIQLMALGTKPLKGGSTVHVNRTQLLTEMNGLASGGMGDKELAYLRLVPAKMNVFDPGIDLKGEVNKEEITIEVPEGDHILYYLVKLTGFTKVTHGAPGASGPVLDHYNKAAVQKYLNRMSDAIGKKIGVMGDYFRSVFIDSMEMHGSNWSRDMLAEFKARNKYDLEPYLPFILFEINQKLAYRGEHLTTAYGSECSNEVQDVIHRVRFDFERTRLALFQERFLDTFTIWCKENKIKSRVQTYGGVYYPLQSAMQVDIPECESWLRPDIGTTLEENSFSRGRAYRPVNKFIASAARLSGKPEVSCEEITNTSMVFNATMARIKITGDQSNLSGVNHSILHGFNYSPKQIPFPGWVRYGTFFNERNTWWPYLRKWIDYKARLSELFQQAEPQADIAVLFPWADMWATHGVQYQQWPQFVRPAYAFNVWEAIHQNGNNCDYIDEEVVQKASFSDGKLNYGSRSYKVLMLLKVETIAPATAVALQKFVQNGGTVFFVEADPFKSPGLHNYEQGDQQVAETIAAIKQQFPDRAVSYPEPSGPVIEWFSGMQSRFNLVPPVSISNPVTHVSQVYFKTRDADVFFFANYSLELSHDFTATFKGKGRYPWKWDPETGTRSPYAYKDGTHEIKIHLDATESLLLVFTDEKPTSLQLPARENNRNGEPLVLSGSWEVSLYKVNEPGPAVQKTFPELIDFKDDADLKSFAGTLFYEKEWTTAEPNGYHFLDLGKVDTISEIWINGEYVGCKWYGRHIYGLKDGILKRGPNRVKIKIVTVLGNYAKSLSGSKEVQKWVKKQPYYSCGLLGPVQLY